MFFIIAFVALYCQCMMRTNTTKENTAFRAISLYVLYLTSLILSTLSYRLNPWHPLAAYPGPLLWRISSLVLCFNSFGGKMHVTIDEFHKYYGKIVRIGEYLIRIKFGVSPICYRSEYAID